MTQLGFNLLGHPNNGEHITEKGTELFNLLF